MECLKCKIFKKGFCFVAWMFFLILANCFYSHAYGFLSDNTYSLPEGKDMLMHPSCYGCLDYEWSSSDDSIITVNEYGIIHAGRVGSAEIKAVNKNDGSESGCRVEVTQPEPIRMVYASSTTACVDKEFEVVATTVKNAEKVKFVANYDGASKVYYTSNKRDLGNCLIWKKNIKIPKECNVSITAYAKIHRSWETCGGARYDLSVYHCPGDNFSSNREKGISNKGADFIASCEGFVSWTYTDSANILTVGYGSRVYPFEPYYNNISQEEGVALLSRTLTQGNYVKSVNRFLRENDIKCNQQQFDALVSFSYNLGCAWMFNGSYLSQILKNCGGSVSYGTVNSDNGLCVRVRPSTSARRICAIPDRTTVTVLSDNPENGNWYRVRLQSGRVGYCCGDFLEITRSGGGERSLSNINLGEFISEVSAYHHAAKRCLKGLLARRFHELDIFIYGVYSRFRSQHFSYGNYPIPQCAKKIM